jgi:hypothetical protein
MSAEQYHSGHCLPAYQHSVLVNSGGKPCRRRIFHNKNQVSTFLHVFSIVCMRGCGENIPKNETLEIDVSTTTMICSF